MPEAPKLQEVRSPSKPLVPSPLTQNTKRIPADLEKAENNFSAEEIDRISEQEQGHPKTFRALYDFEGDANYKEISFEEGELLTVIKENISEGWHLAEKNSIQGLIPIRYVEEFLLNEEPDKFSAEDLNSVASNNRNSIFRFKAAQQI
ncbi:hypothetical protein DSO57_1016849 [Entomophthora muscae]|uniref:Uncharacterized protein n=1 Tax=Entomophthora muscae TaxID=34485 RepID=A0ACC2RJF6_9FUNG|nr:hypothetical protein DSO57_1016849 [Entomophthora muscae]